MNVKALVVLVDRVRAHLLAARRKAGCGNAEAHGSVRVGRRGHVVGEFKSELGLCRARSLQDRTVVGAGARRAVPDHFRFEVQHLLRIRHAPDFVFFADGFFKGRADRGLGVEQLLVAEASDVDVAGGGGRNRVDARAALDRADRKGRARRFGHLEVRDLGARKTDRVNGARRFAEGAVAVAARTLHREAPAVRTDRAEQNAADVGVVDSEESVDFVDGVLFAKEMFASADVAQALFTHGGTEPDVALRFDARFVEGPHGFEHRAHARGVVADSGAVVSVPFAADLDVGARGEDRVHVRADRKERSFGITPGTAADDVADFVDRHVFETRFLHEAHDLFGAGALFKGGCGNFGNVHLKRHRFFCAVFGDRKRFLHAHILRDGVHRRKHGLVDRAGNLFHAHDRSPLRRSPQRVGLLIRRLRGGPLERRRAGLDDVS